MKYATLVRFSVGVVLLALVACAADDGDYDTNTIAGASSSTHVWIQAKTGTRAGLMAQSALYASGSLGGELVFPNRDDNPYNTDNHTQADSVSYSVTIPVAGTWYLWGRLYYPGTTAQATNDPNSFWVSIDGGVAKTLGNRTNVDRTWHWDGYQGAKITLGSLTAGPHTVKVWNREARENGSHLSPRLDMLLLTSSASYIPNDADAGGGSSAAPYPPSTVITGITWSGTIRRGATGSDCWPLTWGDDDALYTAYGDGIGFATTGTNLSLGIAKVTGAAGSFVGSNITSSPTYMGQGAAGRKPSGMLMVNGTLYMWIRNWNYDGTTSRDSKLAYSTDHGAHWSTGSFTLPFGYPTFLNFGKNYAGARDGYVYIYSHDDPSAYVAADRFVLMRVPSDRLTDRTQYQFFVSRDANGNATWSNDIAQRGAVFTHAGHALRSGITYDAGIGRYLWWQMYPVTGEDNRFTGGFGVYDAPTPWGPWTTVYFTTDWGIGPGETASFPTKWMSTDGRTVNLVFSGNDRFSVRQATLTVAGGNQGTFNWSTGTPESQGMSTAALDSAWQGLQSHHTTAFVVIRHDTIAYQRYATNWSFTRPHYTASSAKALVAGMSAAVAISDHRLSLEDYANQYVPTWTNVTSKRDIKLKHLGSHSSGIDDAEEFDANGDPIPHEQLTGWKGAFWDRPAVPNDLFHISRDQAPTLFAPGTRFSYSNPGIAMLAWCITKALVTTHAPQTNLRSLLTARVMQPIGVPASEWNIGYAGTWNVNDGVDTLALVPAHGGANYSPNAMARVARLVREGGNWQGSQLIDSAAVTQTTSNAGINGHGIGWWTNSQHIWSSSLPADAYFGMGSGHQIVLVIPSLDLIVIRQGETLDPVGYPPHADPTGNRAADHYLYAPVMNAITP